MLHRNNSLKITLQKIFKNMKFKVAATAVEKNYRNIEGIRVNSFWAAEYCPVNLMFTKS